MGLSKFKNIMVIDDNDTDLLIAKIVIEKSGYNGVIVTKNSGRSALEYIQSIFNDLEKWPEIIFLDINMPVINGFGFLTEYDKLDAAFRSKVKIVVLTSSDNKNDVDKFSENKSICDFLPKPISIDSFKTIIEKLSV